MSSRPFNARNTSGTCYFCDQAGSADSRIKRGDHVLYLTARAVNLAPGRPLNRRELSIWRKLGRDRKAARRARLPAPSAPEWLWDRMVHVVCAQSNSFPIPGGEASPQNGMRWVGMGDGSQVAGNVATLDPDRAEEARLSAAAARQSVERRREATRVRAAEIAREAREAREASEAAARAIRIAEDKAKLEALAKAEAFERLRVENPGAARFQLLNLDDAPSTPKADDPDEYDPTVDRFRRLDLD